MNSTNHSAAASGQNEANTTQADRLLTFREVGALLGLRCKTGHTARSMADRGLIRVVRLNERVLRYSELSVKALINGGSK